MTVEERFSLNGAGLDARLLCPIKHGNLHLSTRKSNCDAAHGTPACSMSTICPRRSISAVCVAATGEAAARSALTTIRVMSLLRPSRSMPEIPKRQLSPISVILASMQSSTVASPVWPRLLLRIQDV